ncbi:HK97 family phage prohead protease [Tardiphaga sp. 866_E4_N2_1]|uniref:HK97 family phage prohead protease n=1 Tax=unclassified Tardiphaga TaxID=2631404 RepID=UPI003F259729
MTALTRAYSVIEVKALDGKRRTFSGWATTPAMDRVQDIINPMGAKFANPLVLLHQHNHDAPIGNVTFEKPTPKGIKFQAEMPVISDAGPLKDRVDTAWGEIEHGLVRAVSIGFRPLKYAFKDDGGIEFQEIEIFELSTVSIPANAEAIISAVKSIDRRLRDAAGVVDSDIPIDPKSVAATGNDARVVRLADPARDRASPFIIRSIKR